MGSKNSRLFGQVGIDIQHAAIIMTQNAKPVIPDTGCYLGCAEIFFNFFPGILILEVSGYDVIFDA